MKMIDDCGDGVSSATPKTIVFSSGKRLSVGEKVKLPMVAGGGKAVVDSIEMIWGLYSDELTFSVRCVDKKGQGHQFHFKENEK